MDISFPISYSHVRGGKEPCYNPDRKVWVRAKPDIGYRNITRNEPDFRLAMAGDGIKPSINSL